MQKILILLGVVVGIFIISSMGLLMYGQSLESNSGIVADLPKNGRLLADARLKEEIGQMIMIGFRGTEAPADSSIAKVIKDVKIGGVVLFDHDVPSNSFPRNIVDYQQTKKLIGDIQAYSSTPLFVAVDAEGGNVNRLKSKYGFLPIVSAEKMGKDKTLQTTQKESTDLAGELSGLGFNMNLAPVVDVNVNPKNPVIGALGRSFSSDAQEVVRHAEVFIQNHAKKNIITVEKHFPGHGSSTGDSHLGFTDVTGLYKIEELTPYEQLNAGGLLKAVMTAHITDTTVDRDYPATLSKYFLQDVLRDRIGFTGVIISDDMQMSAIISNYTLDEAIVLAINAGVDVISVMNNSPGEYDEDMPYKVRDTIFDAVKSGRIKEERIVESYSRILDLKREFQVIKPS